MDNSDESSQSSVVETSNSFFIHSSDHPGLLLVNKRLNGDNYPTWKRSMIIALTAKNKFGFVDCSIETPSRAKKPADFALWERCDKMVLSWLLNSVEPDLAEGVVYADTAHEIWKDFEDRFSQGNAPRIYQIQKAIAFHTQGSMPVSNYYTKLKGYWDELTSYRGTPSCSYDGMKSYNKFKEQDQIMQFLMGLNDSYNAVHSQILLMKELPSVREAYSLIIQEEKQREIGSPVTQGVSIAAAVKTQKGAGSSYHRSGNQTSFRGTPISSEATLHCTYCNQDHHTVDRCYKLHGYPPGHKLYRGGSNPPGHANTGSASRNGGCSKWHTSSSYANQVQVSSPAAAAQTEQTSTASSHVDQSTQNLKNILGGLSVDQCKQLAAAMMRKCDLEKNERESLGKKKS
ncbi:hypothetical protein L3X38_042119 [Prunus dulcis]|uniref:Retrotransposon Copia-like N-terminal domain-containing protein n=1 Tax=Prunus dulcis TaxID=3755 RepID=A0AAD4UTY7_PRUDU|nr:hypothetical protein L3X38_042119 [Prunus dulcis]